MRRHALLEFGTGRRLPHGVITTQPPRHRCVDRCRPGTGHPVAAAYQPDTVPATVFAAMPLREGIGQFRDLCIHKFPA
ncbi:hypothetical protein [Cupriavidus sp. D384]|uniref:hypothetical protein n=1 Tax=Cupriavidus sp. D384 TaxID=1538095 RepID=UPI000AD466B8|nr:hypothetical protein [Cupriavidus sp. D384]